MTSQHERKGELGYLQRVYMKEYVSTDNTLMSHEVCSCGKSHLEGEGQETD